MTELTEANQHIRNLQRWSESDTSVVVVRMPESQRNQRRWQKTSRRVRIRTDLKSLLPTVSMVPKKQLTRGQTTEERRLATRKARRARRRSR